MITWQEMKKAIDHHLNDDDTVLELRIQCDQQTLFEELEAQIKVRYLSKKAAAFLGVNLKSEQEKSSE